MKKFFLIAGLMMMVAGFSGVAVAGIVGSSHDFSGQGFSQGQICLPCHAPHNADTTVTNVPLWNHTVSTATYTLYSSPTLDAGSPAGTMSQPGGVSKLCLSCHDGTVAVDAFGGRPGTEFISGGMNIGTDLSNDHPVSFVFDAALSTADGALHDPSTSPSGVTGSTGTIQQDMLFADRVECASCHDVHNQFNLSRLLKKDNAGSALCLTCHNK